MEFHQLQYVVIIAKCQNFTRAAEKLSLSQPSLSQQITKLENELGVKLFERTTRSVSLTSAGRSFVEQTEQILSAIERLQFSMQEYAGALNGKFVIGITPVIGKLKLSGLITSFQKKHPGLDIQIVEGGSCVLVDQLCQSKIDVALLTPPVNQDTSMLDFYTLVDDEIVLVVNAAHPFLDKQIIDLAEAKEEKFICPNSTTGAYGIMFDACKKAGFYPHEICECSQVETVRDLIKDQVGITFFSSRIANSIQDPEIGIVRLVNPPKKPTVLATLKRSQETAAVTAFRSFVHQSIDVLF